MDDPSAGFVLSNESIAKSSRRFSPETFVHVVAVNVQNKQHLVLNSLFNPFDVHQVCVVLSTFIEAKVTFFLTLTLP